MSMRTQALKQAKLHFRGCKNIDSLLKRYFAKTKKVYWGRNRIVFDLGTFVVKLPITLNGLVDNDWEGSLSNNPKIKPTKWCRQYARTRLAYRGEVPILFMEKVECADYDEIRNRLGKVPPWVDGIDCGQVGFNKQGKLVAYDYGIR